MHLTFENFNPFDATYLGFPIIARIFRNFSGIEIFLEEEKGASLFIRIDKYRVEISWNVAYLFISYNYRDNAYFQKQLSRFFLENVFIRQERELEKIKLVFLLNNFLSLK